MKLNSIGSRLFMVIAASLVGMVAIVSVSSYLLYQQMITDKIDKTHAVVEIARDVAKSFAARAQAGEIDEATAQALTKATIRGLRYDGKNYVYIHDLTGTVLAHGVAPARENKNFINEKDAAGNDYIQDITQVGKQGGGTVRYFFPKTPGGTPLPKLASIVTYAPWGWLFASGTYIDDVQAQFWSVVTVLGGLAGIVLIVAATTGVLLSRSISRPIRTLSDVTRNIAAGNYAIEVPAAGRGDEVGTLARSIQQLRDEAMQASALRVAQAEQEHRTAGERRDGMLKLAAGFESSVMSVVGTVSLAATEMQTTAGSMAAMAQQGTAETTTVAAAAEQATVNVQTVASAAEELSSSIAEISRQVADAARISATASDEALQTNTAVQQLSAAADRISDVVRLINGIASQTNLLALNATIEAARAGEAGRGFAVVAGEVKSLANQTGRATEEIASQIASVQEETRHVVAAIRNIGAVIGQLREISSNIASAVEEQVAATAEIARNVQQAAQGTQQVSHTIGVVTGAASATEASAARVADSAAGLALNFERLRGEVADFLENIRVG